MALSKRKYYEQTTYNHRENKISFEDNPEQKELIRLIRDKKTQIIFCTGNAGTGKSFSTIYAAYNLVREKQYDKIIYARNPVQLGEEMGYLPGGIEEKYNPFMACLFDNLTNMENLGGPLKTDVLSKIEITPIAFLRGRSLENCLVVIDEAQNLDLITLKAILTRVGHYCKVILLGSLNQIDNRVQAKKEKCDFQRVLECLSIFDFVGSVELVKSKRSEICALVDEKLRELK